MNKPRILIVDDRPQNLFVLQKLLEKLDVDVIQATSGAEALGLTLEHDFCVAIVDVQMPEMDGYELVELIRGNESTAMLPVIFVSAIYSDEYHHRKAYDAGAVDFMSKPFIPEILISKIKVFIDLYNQRKNLQDLVDQLDTAYLQLGIVNRELEQFANSIANELRAPLRAVDGYAHILMEDYLAAMEPDAQECLRHIYSSTQKMDQMIHDLLEFGRLGLLPLQRRRFSMQDIARETMDNLLALHNERRVQVELAELPEVNADPSLIKIVYLNLLDNALKFSRSRQETQIELGYLTRNGQVVYYVRDNGVGFDMQYADKLFGVFQRLHLAEEFEGIGLGLANTRRIINRHNGSIWAEAEVGKGATFYFTLPGFEENQSQQTDTGTQTSNP